MYNTFIRKVCCSRTAQRLEDLGIDGRSMPLAIKAAQDFCNRHEIEPWCRSFVEKENLVKAKESKQSATKGPPIKGRANSTEKKQIKCYNCQRPGHYSYDCLFQGRFNNIKSGDNRNQPATATAANRPAKCHWCNKTNHETKDCRVFDMIMSKARGSSRGRGRGNSNNRGRGGRSGRGRGRGSRSRGSSNMGRANLVTTEGMTEAVPAEPAVAELDDDEGLDFEDEYFAKSQ